MYNLWFRLEFKMLNDKSKQNCEMIEIRVWGEMKWYSRLIRILKVFQRTAEENTKSGVKDSDYFQHTFYICIRVLQLFQIIASPYISRFLSLIFFLCCCCCVSVWICYVSFSLFSYLVSYLFNCGDVNVSHFEAMLYYITAVILLT